MTDSESTSRPPPTPPPKKRDYILILLNILIILFLGGSLALTISGQPGATVALAGPLGLLVILAGLRRRKR